MKILILLWLSLQLLPRANSQEDPPRIIRPPLDTIVLVNQRKNFYCEATGNPRPEITWLKFDWKLPESGRNYRIGKAGALRFRKIYITDTGKYKCIAKNSRGEVHSRYISLQVKAPAVIVRGPTNRLVYYGTKLVLSCVAMGIPMPEILWLKNGTVIKDKYSGYNFSSPRLVINATETAQYSCEIRNKILNKVYLDRKESTVTVLGRPKEEKLPKKELPANENTNKPNSPPKPSLKPAQTSPRPDTQTPSKKKPGGYCAPYNGTVCRQYIGGQSVFFNLSYDYPEQVYESIVQGLWEEMLSTFDMKCRGPAERMLCHYAFPDCDKKRSEPAPAQICREQCYAVKDLYCLPEWLLLTDNINKGIYISSRAHFRLPICAKLPSRHNSTEVCSEVKIYERRPDLVSSACYKGRGQYYNGTVNVTKDGIVCQSWEAGTPHPHRRPPDIFPELENSHNYCRNPGSEHEAPWCYTMDINIRWQSCDIPKCDVNISTGEVSENPLLASAGDGLPIDLVSLVIITLVSVLTIGIVILITILCHRLYLQDRRYIVTNQEDMDIDLSCLPSNAIYQLAAPMSLLNPKLEALEYSRNDIVYIRDLGQGAFGRVFQASCAGLIKGSDVTLTAVKMLKDDATEDLHLDFEREASLMVEYDHPNIVRLLGVCAIGKPLCLLFEFMNQGDLHGFLKLCSPDNNNSHPERERELIPHSNRILTKLEYLEQLTISLQITAGMKYLAEKKYVHRDLATRNCLVGENLTVKISDFGLARSIENGDYYIGDEQDAIPIRWTPIEAVLYNKFTVESDVWSFGVVLWEIFSFAQQPYSDLTHEEVIKFIKDGNTLTPPSDTPQEICEMMQLCWHRKASSRPSFQKLHRSFKALVSDQTEIKNRTFENHNHRQS